MRDNNLFLNIGNTFSKLVLQSPAHRIMSRNTMLITYSDRYTGESITVPVDYVETDKELLVLIHRERDWWKNLRKGAPVTLTLQGRRMDTWAESTEDPEEVVLLLTNYFHKAPKIAKILGVNDPAQDNRICLEFREAADQFILIRIKR